MSASEQVAGASGTILPAPAGVLLADGSPAFGAYAGNVSRRALELCKRAITRLVVDLDADARHTHC